MLLYMYKIQVKKQFNWTQINLVTDNIMTHCNILKAVYLKFAGILDRSTEELQFKINQSNCVTVQLNISMVTGIKHIR